jgi:hypothetical protein
MEQVDLQGAQPHVSPVHVRIDRCQFPTRLPEESGMSKELEARLDGWAQEYAGGRYEHNGWSGKSWMSDMVKYHGRAPQGMRQRTAIGTPADEVEAAVQQLERLQDGFRPGRVLRAEYWMPHLPEEARRQALRQIGLPMSRDGYQMFLARARAFVAAQIKVPCSERASLVASSQTS